MHTHTHITSIEHASLLRPCKSHAAACASTPRRARNCASASCSTAASYRSASYRSATRRYHRKLFSPRPYGRLPRHELAARGAIDTGRQRPLSNRRRGRSATRGPHRRARVEQSKWQRAEQDTTCSGSDQRRVRVNGQKRVCTWHLECTKSLGHASGEPPRVADRRLPRASPKKICGEGTGA